MLRPLFCGLLFAMLLILGCSKNPAAETGNVPAKPEYQAAIEKVREFIRYQMEDKSLPALSIALSDESGIIWSEGFGEANREKKIPADGGTVYRVASLSKLFTAIGVMQLAEAGVVDIDAPVTNYLPDFQPENPFETEITLRQLMSHRSGLVREPPVGSYFDPEEPGTAALVASLNNTRLVYPPETRTKYSNAAVSVAGLALEKAAGVPFEKYMQEKILSPIGMSRSSFDKQSKATRHLATGYMWTYEGRRFEAPLFQLGMIPAAGMYASVNDLARFLQVLINDGQMYDGELLSPETLKKMWEVQYAEEGQTSGFGLGFYLSDLDGHQQIRHGGVMYGYASRIAALPDAGFGAITIITEDCANIVADQINNYAFRLLLAAKEGQPLPDFPRYERLTPERMKELSGHYSDGEGSVELKVRNGELLLRYGGEWNPLKQAGENLILDGRLSHGTLITIEDDDSFRINNRLFRKFERERPAALPEHWKGLVGEYGWDHNTLYILEKGGRLYALIEWFFYYPLTEISADVYAFPDYGLYHGEQLIFQRDENGKSPGVTAASVYFERRRKGFPDGDIFKIDPVIPPDSLRELAFAAQPPAGEGHFLPSDLVELKSLASDIKYDIRYASDNNFMGMTFYQQEKAYLQRPAAEALIRVHRRMKRIGYGLLIYDAYRPWYVTKMFWDATPEAKKIFVANPANGSRHNRGCAVDLSLYELQSGAAVEMVSGYDEFTDRAYPWYPGESSLQRYYRQLLYNAMIAEGFTVYKAEWWHYDFTGWEKYPIMNETFEAISEK